MGMEWKYRSIFVHVLWLIVAAFPRDRTGWPRFRVAPGVLPSFSIHLPRSINGIGGSRLESGSPMASRRGPMDCS